MAYVSRLREAGTILFKDMFPFMLYAAAMHKTVRHTSERTSRNLNSVSTLRP